MDFEKLGAFYLGKRHDLDTGETKEELILYDSKDLTTHAVCVGMTGSGKTGLCVSLLEEAAIDGIPAIAIDPKGDLGNLMLTFPDLQSSDFRPWIDESEALRKGQTPEAFAASTAKQWKKGLAEWGQDGDRIRRLKEKAEVRIYTPGSTAGIPLAILRSFDAPPSAILEDSEALQDRIQSAVSGLLALLGKEADPLQSREHILIANILDTAWRAGRSLDLPSLIREIQQPPFSRIGVFDLESFYPASERMGLALGINGIIASPGFETWLKGEPMDIGRMLYTKDGRPRLSVISIAHLEEKERMFFVTILLNEIVAWMRSQPGTSSLRAMLYMDEIFGYFPPTATPPSKKPMLTLLKQARAYGLGVMLATQNPVDLDYKGLSNTGTWFIGRLQTERDKARVLDGLQGASNSTGTEFDRSAMERILSQVGKRVFLMHNVHDSGPKIFHTRWAMSYLRGPMTRTHIQKLMAPFKPPAAAPVEAAPTTPADAAAGSRASAPAAPPMKAERPILPEGVNEFYLSAERTVEGRLVYRPMLLANTRLHYAHAASKTDEWIFHAFLCAFPTDEPFVDWSEAESIGGGRVNVARSEEPNFAYGNLQEGRLTKTRYNSWQKELKSYIYQDLNGIIWRSPLLKAYSELNEEEGVFRGKLMHKLREKRDLESEKLRKKYEKKVAVIEDRVRRAEQKIEKEQEQYRQSKFQTAISVGATIVGAMFGSRRSSIGKATTAMRGAGRAAREQGDVARAEEDLMAQQAKLKELETQFADDLAEVEEALDPSQLELQEITVRPRKTDISLFEFGILWCPVAIGADGLTHNLYTLPEEAAGAEA
jgi:hypothetical protein